MWIWRLMSKLQLILCFVIGTSSNLSKKSSIPSATCVILIHLCSVLSPIFPCSPRPSWRESEKTNIIPSIRSATDKLLHPSAFKQKIENFESFQTNKQINKQTTIPLRFYTCRRVIVVIVAGYFSPHFHRHWLQLLLLSSTNFDDNLLDLDTALWPRTEENTE